MDGIGAQRAETNAWQHCCQDAALLSKRHDVACLDVYVEPCWEWTPYQ
jgi:hypothetical protein